MGNKAVISFPALSEFALIFVPTVVRANAKEAKKAAARLSHLSMRSKGSQSTSPYSWIPALVTAMPAKLQSMNAIGIMNGCTY